MLQNENKYTISEIKVPQVVKAKTWWVESFMSAAIYFLIHVLHSLQKAFNMLMKVLIVFDIVFSDVCQTYVICRPSQWSNYPNLPTLELEKSQNSSVFDLFGKAAMLENILYLNNDNIS